MTDRSSGRLQDVSRETTEKLELYAALVRKWNRAINLVAASTVQDIWHRHFVDSAQLLDLGKLDGRWVDLGSGGGFPGLVVAILAQEMTNAPGFVLVESDQRKAEFLREAARQTGTPVDIIAERSEDLEPLAAATLSARALAPLDKLMSHAQRHLVPGGVALFPKGVGVVDELKVARRHYHFDVDLVPSVTDNDAKILKISEVRCV